MHRCLHQPVKEQMFFWLGLAICLNMQALQAWEDAAPGRQPLSFSRDVRPILSNNCFQCHGPDEAQRQADVRLDVAGEMDLDEVLLRIRSLDAELLMPPPDSHKELTAEQIALVERWVAEGGEYEAHWAFVPPRSSVPPLADHSLERTSTRWLRFGSIQREGLAPSPPADKRTLIRRLTLDLTGLPPTPEEIAAFVADESTSGI